MDISYSNCPCRKSSSSNAVLGRSPNPMILLLTEIEKVWIRRVLDSDSIDLRLSALRDALENLWNSKMAADDYADFAERLPIC